MKWPKKDVSNEGILALNMWRDGKAKIQWVALDAFRIWYSKLTPEGLELTCKEFVIKEVK
jgi:hypothetical protein